MTKQTMLLMLMGNWGKRPSKMANANPH